jgi:MoxR-like ATPase
MIRSLTQVERVVVLGRGGAGKSTFARHRSQIAGLPVIELDRHFWSEDLSPISVKGGVHVQERLAVGDRWLMDEPRPKTHSNPRDATVRDSRVQRPCNSAHASPRVDGQSPGGQVVCWLCSG